ncbi:MAG: Exonuclease RNase and polymerase [Anaeromyxobacteraceae bacterium]|nr:Exonuclease RNase and polymerase [Anaeromyxobacteraceae bacterium]
MIFSSPRWDLPVYWALDLETGGLDPRHDPIIAVGMVPVRSGVIRLGESFSTLIRPDPGRPIRPESVRAHQLLAGDLRKSPPLHAVLLEVGRRLADGVLLVHNQGIDVPFLKEGHARTGVPWRKPKVVDTVDLIVKAATRRRFFQPGQEEMPSLNLSEARRAQGLPDYQAHDALIDAVATAELFLVLRQATGAKTLRDLR